MAKKSTTGKSTPSAKAKKKASSKNKTPVKKAAKGSFSASKQTKTSLRGRPPVEKSTVETTLETPREPAREIEPGASLTPQAKMKIPRRNERNFREQQQIAAKPNSVNPASRK